MPGIIRNSRAKRTERAPISGKAERCNQNSRIPQGGLRNNPHIADSRGETPPESSAVPVYEN
jgi:hypothetical protein